LDLQPGVDFEERDGAVLADQELAGAGAHVAGLAEDRLGRGAQDVFLRLGQVRGRGLLDPFLVAPLPATSGAPARWAIFLAATLSPRSRIACGGGPIQVSPASRTAWAKSAFSDR